jgi:hypothetical protein
MFLSVASVAYLTLKLYLDPLKPGVWLNDGSFMVYLGLLLIFIGCAAAAPIVAFYYKLKLLGFAILIVLGFGWTISGGEQAKLNAVNSRYKVEGQQYKNALQSQAKFGEQSSENVNGRILTYWRWAQTGPDNAIGVIYDPADTLMKQKGDKEAFLSKMHGIIVRVHRIESKWYAVWHT